MVIHVKIARSGSSLAIFIPPAIRDALKLAWRDELALAVAGDQLIITRVRPEEEAKRFGLRRGERG
jgi:antitoxin component of MazEF toxin-antitoxin module